MFAAPRPKRRVVERPFYRKKRKTQIEEITFDPDARHEYLTGFRKRKLQRAKRAAEQATKKAREEKNELRRKVRRPRSNVLYRRTGTLNMDGVLDARRAEATV